MTKPIIFLDMESSDNDRQCQNFETHGGKAILFPQRWNQNWEHEYDPIGYVR